MQFFTNDDRGRAADVDTSKLNMEAAFTGVIAAIALAIVTLAAPLLGLQAVDIPRGLGAMAWGLSPLGTGPTLMGWVVFFTLHIGVAMAYAWQIARRSPRAGVLSGVLSALAPWALLQLVGFPLMGMGVFASNTGHALGYVLTSLFGYLAFGAVLGGVLRTLMNGSSIPRIDAIA